MVVMDPERLRTLLQEVRIGATTPEDALTVLKSLPFDDLGFAKVDHHRHLRTGLPEVVYGEGKSADQIVQIATAILARGQNALVTRIDAAKAAVLCAAFPQARHHEAARVVAVVIAEPQPVGRGTIALVAAGTSDIGVAEEAGITAELMGNRVSRLYDVGVAGIHRLFAHRSSIDAASVVIVVAGMEGALPSVVAGLIDKPVIAVPTSVGYGASFGGLAALLGMLNSCAAGVTVVNIDNGFGAGVAAGLINRV